jgi:hypothetical protein
MPATTKMQHPGRRGGGPDISHHREDFRMPRNGRMPAIDADGHILERRDDIAKYLDSGYRKRHGPLVPGGQPWDTEMSGTLGM